MKETCGAARRELLSPGPRSFDDNVAKAQDHVAQCASCRAFVAEMAALSEAVRASGMDTTPAAVRERLFAKIAAARAGSYERRDLRARVPWLAAVGLAAAVVLALVFQYSRGSERASEFMAAIAQDHGNALSGDRFESGDRQAIEKWLATRLSFAVFVPELEGAQLVGARICPTPSGRGAVVEYRVGGRLVSYFILPQPDRPAAPAGRFRHAHAAGYRAVIWSDMGLTHAMLGAVAPGVLERLARDCVRKVTAAVTASVGRDPRDKSWLEKKLTILLHGGVA